MLSQFPWNPLIINCLTTFIKNLISRLLNLFPYENGNHVVKFFPRRVLILPSTQFDILLNPIRLSIGTYILACHINLYSGITW